MSYYAVAKGRTVGIYPTWNECKDQIHQFSGAVYKKFGTREEAQQFITKNNSAPSASFCSKGGSKKSTSYPTQKTYALGKAALGAASTSKRLLSTLNSSDSEDDECKTISHKQKKHKSNGSSSNNENGFFVDENGFTEVYTDGACTGNGKKNAKAGIGVWFADGHRLNVSQPVVGRATNNMAEIQAVTIAAKQAEKAGIKKLKINTDSQFLINCITKWMPKWKRNGWKSATGNPVINKQELIEMEKALAPLNISWNHVNGHVGIYGNEMADKLASEGSNKYKPT